MISKPPQAAAWLIEFLVPAATAEPAVGDLAEEFAERAARSEAEARRWYWRQALSTIPHLMWTSVRLAPRSTVALALCSLALIGFADRMITSAAGLLLTNVKAYDYIGAAWFWRTVDAIRFVVVPFSLGWSFAALARDRQMVITALSACLLMAVLGWNLTVLVERHLAESHHLFGSPGGRRVLYEVIQSGTTVPLSVVAGGVLRRLLQMRGGARTAG